MSGNVRARTFEAAAFQRELLARYPDLSVSIEGGELRVRGSFPVLADGRPLDRFLIEVLLPARFPDAEPVVREIGSRIPHTADRHISADGTACTHAPGTWLRSPLAERTLVGFLDGPVRNFFLGQLAVEAGLRWPFGEWDHGRPGLIAAYSEILGVQGEEAVVRYLAYLQSDVIQGHLACPCGSGEILRRCHLDDIRRLQKAMPPLAARAALARLEREP